MLKTLLKYEWKDTWGLCTACNGIALILSVIGALMISLWHYSDDKTFTDTQTTMLGVAFSFYIIIYCSDTHRLPSPQPCLHPLPR